MSKNPRVKCIVCGRSFSTEIPNKKICSPSCKRKYLISKSKEQFALNEEIHKATACGLSYGQYKIKIAQGKTYEELLAEYEPEHAAEREKFVENFSPFATPCNREDTPEHLRQIFKPHNPLPEEPPPVPKNTKICPACGEEFKPSRSNQTYCSRACHQSAGNAHKKSAKENGEKSVKKCPVCGKEFEPIRFNQIYCSYFCGMTAWHKPKDYPVKKCVVCGEEFKPRTFKTVTCSRQCAIKWNYWKKKTLDVRR